MKAPAALILVMSFLAYAPIALAGARGGDTAYSILHGTPDRLHQPWAGFEEPGREGTGGSVNTKPQQEDKRNSEEGDRDRQNSGEAQRQQN